MYQNKVQLRRFFRQQRQNLSDSQQQQAAQGIANQLHSLIDAETKPDNLTVAAYLCNDGEPNLAPFINDHWAKRQMILLPVLHPFCKGYVFFQQYQSHTAMAQNRFAIDEPTLSCIDLIPLKEIDIVLMPLVAFDTMKNRLGMGGGFYDRTLSQLKIESRPKLIGIAHTNQYSERPLPTESWDIPLDHVVTPDYVL